MFQRNIEPLLLTALADTPVVLLNGARQVGKSTLAQRLIDTGWRARYVTLDDATVQAAARSDPQGFLSDFDGPVIIDEIQRASELYLPIKLSVDRNRKPGRFLLTGSANVMLTPALSNALAGRMEVLTLWPLSQGEISGYREDFVDRLLAKDFSLPASSIGRAKKYAIKREDLAGLILRGGFPEVVKRPDAERRRAWFRSYITTILQRDVRDLSKVEGITEFPRLLALLATRVANLLNLADISRATTISHSTLKRYMTLLQATYLISLLPPWTSNLGARVVKTPKLMLGDTGLLTALVGVDEERLLENSALFGAALENFVVMETRKQISWSKTQPQMFHFRTHSGHEVDIVLEEASGKLAGIEVKSIASVNSDDFKGLRALQEIAGKNFRRGVVFYAGSEVVSFGKDLMAAPIPVLWEKTS